MKGHADMYARDLLPSTHLKRDDNFILAGITN